MKAITKEQLDHAAHNLFAEHGNKIRKQDVRFAVMFFLCEGFEQDRIIDRIWYRIKKLIKVEK